MRVAVGYRVIRAAGSKGVVDLVAIGTADLAATSKQPRLAAANL